MSMAPLRKFVHQGTVSYIFDPSDASVMSETSNAQDDEFSVVVPHLKEQTSQSRTTAPEETVDAVLCEIEDATGNVVRYRVKFGDGEVYDVSESGCERTSAQC